jgi:hypothetical protein
MMAKAGSLDIGIKRESGFLFGFKHIDHEAPKRAWNPDLQECESRSAWLSSRIFSLLLHLKSGEK